MAAFEIGTSGSRGTGTSVKYVVRWRDRDGRDRSKTFTKGHLQKARAFDRQIAVDLAENVYVDPHAGKITLEDWATLWLASHSVSASTRAKYRS